MIFPNACRHLSSDYEIKMSRTQLAFSASFSLGILLCLIKIPCHNCFSTEIVSSFDGKSIPLLFPAEFVPSFDEISKPLLFSAELLSLVDRKSTSLLLLLEISSPSDDIQCHCYFQLNLFLRLMKYLSHSCYLQNSWLRLLENS